MKRAFWGLILIALGTTALLQTVGTYNFGLSFWPVVLTLIGTAIFTDSFIGRRGPQWFGMALGLWVGAMGLFQILNHAGVTPGIDGYTILSGGWPILLIAIGVSIVFGRGPRIVISGRHSRRDWDGGSSRYQVVGDLRYGRDPWVLEKDLELSNAVGDLKVDLTTASITPGTHRINVSQFVGETVLKVPEDVTVRVTAEANVGELDVLGDHRSGTGLFIQKEIVIAESDVELVIDAHQRVGSLRIIRYPSAGRRIIE